MGLPKPQYIANLLVQSGNNPDYKKLDEQIFILIKKQIPDSSNEEILDYIEEFQKDIANELFEKENENKIDGITINFDINEEDDGYYIRFFDKPEIKLLRKLQSDSSENFEVFCKNILDKLGGKSKVTGGQNDGGIDFVATDISLYNLPIPSTKGSRVLVLGQAKKKEKGNHITEKDLREFVGAVIKKADEYKKTRSDQFGILHPIILAFWTTSDFHIDARNYARELGIWYLSGIALCQLALQLGLNEN